jgi:hypothetical protein
MVATPINTALPASPPTIEWVLAELGLFLGAWRGVKGDHRLAAILRAQGIDPDAIE